MLVPPAPEADLDRWTGGQGCVGKGGAGLPSHCPPLTPSASLNGICNRQ